MAVLGICISLAGLLIIIFGGLIGTYVVSQTRDTTQEISGQAIVNEIQKVNAKLDNVADDVKELSTSKAEQAAKIEAHDKAIAESDTEIKIVDSKVGVLENKVSKLQAQVEK